MSRSAIQRRRWVSDGHPNAVSVGVPTLAGNRRRRTIHMPTRPLCACWNNSRNSDRAMPEQASIIWLQDLHRDQKLRETVLLAPVMIIACDKEGSGLSHFVPDLSPVFAHFVCGHLLLLLLLWLFQFWLCIVWRPPSLSRVGIGFSRKNL